MGFEPTNSYETSPSTLRNIWRKLYYVLRQSKSMKHPPKITIQELGENANVLNELSQYHFL